MPDAPAPITSTPNVPGQPYDATDDGPVVGWSKPTDSGPADPGTFDTHGDWPDGPGPWRQV